MMTSLTRLGRKWLYNTKLRHKILYTYLLLILVPLGAYQFVVSDKVSGLLINHVTYSAEQGFNQTYAFLSYRLQRIGETTDVLIANPSILRSITDPGTNTDIHRQLQDYSDLKQQLRSLQDGTDIARVTLYVDSQYVFGNESENFLPLNLTEGNACFERLVENNPKMLWCSPSEIETKGAAANQYLYVVRSLLDPNNYKHTVGRLRVDVRADTIRDILKNANAVENSVTYLASSDSRIVLSSDPIASPPPFPLPATGTLQDGTVSAELDGTYYLYRPIPSSQWSMVTAIPIDEVMKQSRQLRNDLLALLLVVALAAHVVAYLLSVSVTRRISHLTGRLKDVEKGSLIPLAQTQGKDEIGELIKTYNFMIDKISTMHEEQYKLGQEVKSAELKALQSQINPHFLYNTLDLINWMASSGMNDEIRQVVKALSRFYKVSLSSGRDVVTVGEELKHVSFYVQIQNIRFENKIRLVADVPEELLGYAIPKITFQPIVENAILHGILGRVSREGTVTISAAKEADDLVITIADDGIGMKEELVRQMDAGTYRGSLKGSGYGSRNVLQRLQHVFGEGYGLSYRSTPGEGTTVTLRIPAVQPPEE
ncbi:cache domain-containing sensor histidine kinase [Paenibacillus mucilaginosus]|uniref:histidine kinase n=2 Tax=Paenibacillus mucilaginosus TaxID=61624 RepID=H6NAB6_9BACL|nr:sensor histidine kinase [Paenibacillus mucilaginosus]AEI40758.1 putative two-component sensor kinase YesM [Paenibacillus mucilaginosus KNP414]AFC29362.1 putative two-component sensor kinase YesM [Paenibacillus mucilaginosus 3016]MCG7211762.1 sensor histidine kinase [Paenibacillus mucilaginosus]WDM29885.1 sensor histidine kinase [Paenibacillus mucilaginosus]WFA18079.1 sensor histidine kinase [Paenibacillus mucilaginosus]